MIKLSLRDQALLSHDSTKEAPKICDPPHPTWQKTVCSLTMSRPRKISVRQALSPHVQHPQFREKSFRWSETFRTSVQRESPGMSFDTWTSNRFQNPTATPTSVVSSSTPARVGASPTRAFGHVVRSDIQTGRPKAKSDRFHKTRSTTMLQLGTAYKQHVLRPCVSWLASARHSSASRSSMEISWYVTSPVRTPAILCWPREYVPGRRFSADFR